MDQVSKAKAEKKATARFHYEARNFGVDRALAGMRDRNAKVKASKERDRANWRKAVSSDLTLGGLVMPGDKLMTMGQGLSQEEWDRIFPKTPNMEQGNG